MVLINADATSSVTVFLLNKFKIVGKAEFTALCAWLASITNCLIINCVASCPFAQPKSSF